MKTLHIKLSEQKRFQDKIIALQKEKAGTEIEVIKLSPQNAHEVLKKIFQAESICVWN